MRKNAVLPLLLSAVSLITINCSENDEAAPNYDGNWSGTTSQGKSISFTVSGNKVTSIDIGYTLAGNCSPAPTGANVTSFSGIEISGKSFSISGGTAVSGTFSSGNAASGSFTINFTSNPPGYSSTASGTWSVNK